MRLILTLLVTFSATAVHAVAPPRGEAEAPKIPTLTEALAAYEACDKQDWKIREEKAFDIHRAMLNEGTFEQIIFAFTDPEPTTRGIHFPSPIDLNNGEKIISLVNTLLEKGEINPDYKHLALEYLLGPRTDLEGMTVDTLAHYVGYRAYNLDLLLQATDMINKISVVASFTGEQVTEIIKTLVSAIPTQDDRETLAQKLEAERNFLFAFRQIKNEKIRTMAFTHLSTTNRPHIAAICADWLNPTSTP